MGLSSFGLISLLRDSCSIFLVPEASYEEELIPPAFVQKPKFQKIEEGTTVSFTAQVVATPKPEVREGGHDKNRNPKYFKLLSMIVITR